MIYTTALDTYAVTDLSAAGRALIDDASAGDQRTTLGLGTMATQNANSVAITGGTISGITNISDNGNTLPFSFSTTITDSDPGSGVFRLDNATQNTATNIYIDDEDSNAVDVSAFIQTLSGGNNPSSILGLVTLRKEFAPEVFLQFKVTGIINAAGYTKLAVTNLSSSTANPFSNSDNVLIDISLSGDKGDAGDITGPVSSTDNAIARWDGTSGNLIQDSSVTIDDSNNLTGVVNVTATGNLIVDTNTLYVDATGNRVGIGRTPTTNALEVAGTIESTSGGFKFPDGSTQTKSAGHGLSAMIALGMA